MIKTSSLLTKGLVVFLMVAIVGFFGTSVFAANEEIPENTMRIHYQRDNGDYENWGLWIWNDTTWSSESGWPDGMEITGYDDYGAYWDVPLKEGAANLGFLMVNQETETKDGGDKVFNFTVQTNELWTEEGSDEIMTSAPANIPDNTLRVHYQRKNGDYENWGLWIWNDTTWSSESGWPDGMEITGYDDFGAYWDVPLKEGAANLGFLMVNQKTQVKDGEEDKGFTMLDEYNQVYVFEGDSKVYISENKDTATGLLNGEIVSRDKVLLNFTSTQELDSAELRIEDSEGKRVDVESINVVSETSAEVVANLNLDKVPLKVTYGNKEVDVSTGWRLIDNMYSYDGELGADYFAGGVTLRLWAPKASKVVAHFYDKYDQSREIGAIELEFNKRTGVWEKWVSPYDLGLLDVKGYYYQYAVTNNGVTRRVLDPYAKSMAAFTVNTAGQGGEEYVVNGETVNDNVGKAAIVEPKTIGPKLEYADIEGFNKKEDAIIWEIHIRDFTSDPSIEGDLDSRWGTYNAFKDKLEYIKSLGVTHVQILPVMAWYYGDETAMGERELDYSAQNNSYNWGYDPHNYFSPDGAYSENPEDPEARIRELKSMIDAIHDAGMGVILDVVYTHMAKASFLNDIVPGYYFFQDANGNFVGDFGNNLATTHKMAEKLMIDSVKYWFKEYKIDGMRWDMMGDATADSVQKAYNEAKKLNPNVLFVGEGWRTFKGHVENPNLVPADQDWMDQTNAVAVFSDEMRNEMKSGFGIEGQPRFITGGARPIELIFNNIIAKPTNVTEDDPGDILQYIAAHDNMTLHDVIAQSIKKDPDIHEEEIQKRIRLGNSVILTSQGISFLHAGQEYGRTKQWRTEGQPEQKFHTLENSEGELFEYPYFVHDSYDSSDAINMFDWGKVTEEGMHKETMEFTKGLIALRKSTDAFRLGTEEMVKSNVKLIESEDIKEEDLVIGYHVKSTDGEEYVVFINADSKERKVETDMNLAFGTILVDSDEAGTEEVSEVSGVAINGNTIILDALTPSVIKIK
ncbi:pullulanase [Geotoga petraea]|uniref:pullulanase n=1 Tax=Geotoga petraea TaxID=28234 RepID=A0A1G6QPH5_9BACT|nr:pullulanase [Geotoga petraea]SDC94173.1 pullulanase, extracellular [Geotoga petraea]